MRTVLGLTAAAILALPAAADVAPITPAPVVAAERAFAADGAALGFKASFLKHSAPDAIVIQPEPVNAWESLRAAPDSKPDDPRLEWWPIWAGISASGDLGFTTGPYSVAGKRRGHYFTVWKKQQDGQWKWVFDGGVGSDPVASPGPDSTPGFLQVSRVRGQYPESAMAGVKAAEAAMAVEARTDSKAAYLKVLACDARIQASPMAPATGCSTFGPELDWRAKEIDFSAVGGDVSSAGDMAWTYGTAGWVRDGAPVQAHYVRVWQRRAEGWKIVFDELLIPPPPRPAAITPPTN
ncbi:MAG: nuclear transport factor 2 family protein [Caulobacter sp.]|nr:nuclear transport factor 2 family protein [Caulobacter sp.]